MTTEEKNVAIAKMLSWKLYSDNKHFIIPKPLNKLCEDHFQNLGLPEELKFHSDANWQFEAIERIKYISENSKNFFGKYVDIQFLLDFLNGVELYIDKKRVFMQTSFGENQLKGAIFEALYQFSQYLKQKQ